MGNGCLTEEHIKELVRILNKILTEHFNRYAARQGKFTCRATCCLVKYRTDQSLMLSFYDSMHICIMLYCYANVAYLSTSVLLRYLGL